MTPDEKEFTCTVCHETFEKGRADEAVLDEAEALFGQRPPEDLKGFDEVCEVCWRKMGFGQ